MTDTTKLRELLGRATGTAGDDSRKHAARLLERMKKTPFGPKRGLLAAQHVAMCQKAREEDARQAAAHEWLPALLDEVERHRSALEKIAAHQPTLNLPSTMQSIARAALGDKS